MHNKKIHAVKDPDVSYVETYIGDLQKCKIYVRYRPGSKTAQWHEKNELFIRKPLTPDIAEAPLPQGQNSPNNS